MKDWALARLIAAKIASPRLELRMMLADLQKREVGEVELGDELSEEQKLGLMAMVERRCAREPLDKILGYKDFYKNRFRVGPEVLSPRSDSEILVEAAIELAQKQQIDNILELGVGSGCLILSVLQEIKNMRGLGIDKSAAALEVARSNAKALGVAERAELRQGDYFEELSLGRQFSMLISNPPYIPSRDIGELEPEVKNYDPVLALDGGDDGYVHYRRIAEIAPELLCGGGYILLEAGWGQAENIAAIFENRGFCWQDTICDLSGIKRCVVLQKQQ